MLKSSLLLKKFTNFTVNNSRILRIKNVKFSGYCFHLNTNIYRDFQICISVPLIIILRDFIKQPIIKQSPTFFQFFFSHWLFFLFHYQSICKFWKIHKISGKLIHCIQKWRKFENVDGNILLKTCSL